ncbi:hypothetical protein YASMINEVIRUS_250 [Yasminevirus sp. GU-2018]|uniref:C2H2-type domain-containing protein n=1 Tax=Yasminevirus sp. GU-2018 TaxID=2420051 RepID=A0A5K0U7M6_9VIRU|nr:hypothetical protein YASMINEVIRUS_250 [Yasminevirus sp. GU-2018]
MDLQLPNDLTEGKLSITDEKALPELDTQNNTSITSDTTSDVSQNISTDHLADAKIDDHTVSQADVVIDVNENSIDNNQQDSRPRVRRDSSENERIEQEHSNSYVPQAEVEDDSAVDMNENNDIDDDQNRRGGVSADNEIEALMVCEVISAGIIQNYHEIGAYVCTLAHCNVNIPVNISDTHTDQGDTVDVMALENRRTMEIARQVMFHVEGHYRSAGMEGLGIYTCRFCGAEFYSSENRHTHITEVHPDSLNSDNNEEDEDNESDYDDDYDYPFRCPVCERGYNNQIGLGTHFMLRHNNYQDLHVLDNIVRRDGFPGFELLVKIGMIKFINDSAKIECDVCPVCCIQYTGVSRGKTDDHLHSQKEIHDMTRSTPKHVFSKFTDDMKILYLKSLDTVHRYPVKLVCCRADFCTECLRDHVNSRLGEPECPFCRKSHTRRDLRFVIYDDRPKSKINSDPNPYPLLRTKRVREEKTNTNPTESGAEANAEPRADDGTVDIADIAEVDEEEIVLDPSATANDDHPDSDESSSSSSGDDVDRRKRNMSREDHEEDHEKEDDVTDTEFKSDSSSVADSSDTRDEYENEMYRINTMIAEYTSLEQAPEQTLDQTQEFLQEQKKEKKDDAHNDTHEAINIVDKDEFVIPLEKYVENLEEGRKPEALASTVIDDTQLERIVEETAKERDVNHGIVLGTPSDINYQPNKITDRCC